jgi:hypothetical protein
MELEAERLELKRSEHLSSIREKRAAFMMSSYKSFRDAGVDDETAYNRAEKALKNMPSPVLPVARRAKLDNIPSPVVRVAGTSRAESMGESPLRKAFALSSGPSGIVVHVIEEESEVCIRSLSVLYSC